MNLADVAVYIALIAIATITIIVVTTNPFRPANLVYGTLGATIVLWLSANSWTLAALNERDAWWGIVISTVAAGWIQALAHWLRVTIREQSLAPPLNARRFCLFAVLAIAITLMSFHPDFLIRVEFRGFPPIAEPVYGHLHKIYGVYHLVSMALFVWLARRDIRSVTGIAHIELKYFLLGTAFAMFMGATFGIAVVWALGTSRYLPLSNALSILTLSTVTGYGLIARRILSFEEVSRELLARALVVAKAIALYGLVFYLASWGMKFFREEPSVLPHWIAAVVLGVASPRLVELARGGVLRLWPKARQLPSALEERAAAQRLLAAQSVSALLGVFIDLMQDLFEARHVRVLARQGNELVTIDQRPADLPSMHLSVHSPTVRWFREQTEPVPRYALERRRLHGDAVAARQTMADFDIDLAVVLEGSEGDLYMIALGPRPGHRVYDAREIALFASIVLQFPFAMANARLYTEVEDARRYNETLLEHLGDGVIACDASGRVTAVNREAARLLHLAGAPPTPRTLADLPDPLRTVFEQVLKSEMSSDGELRLGGDPEPCFVRVSAGVLRRGDRERAGVIATLRDTTAFRRFEERARRADRLASVGTLAAFMAHEIKNPLMTIKTFIQVVPKMFDDPDVRESFLPLVANAADRINNVVNRVLDFSRPVQPSLAPVHIHSVLATTLRLVDPRRRAAGVEIVHDLQAADDRILGDAQLLEQVFVNLCFNAIEAMPHGGVLTLSTARVQIDSGQRDLWGNPVRVPRLRVSVRDTGVGIPPDVLPRIFDPFFTTKPDGSGLGLAIALGILNEHHATIDVESQPGTGTVFHVLFVPLDETSEEPVAP